MQAVGGLTLVGVVLGACVDCDPGEGGFELGVGTVKQVEIRPPAGVNTEVEPNGGNFLVQLREEKPN